MTPGKTRQKTYRRRMQESGCRQVTVWLNADAYTALQLLLTSQHADASTVTSDAIRHYHAVTSYQPSSNAPITSDVTGSAMPVTGDVTGYVTSDQPTVTHKRYQARELENRILALRESGLSLGAIAERLADDGEQYTRRRARRYCRVWPRARPGNPVA